MMHAGRACGHNVSAISRFQRVVATGKGAGYSLPKLGDQRRSALCGSSVKFNSFALPIASSSSSSSSQRRTMSTVGASMQDNGGSASGSSTAPLLTEHAKLIDSVETFIFDCDEMLKNANDGRCAMNAADIAFHILGNRMVGNEIEKVCEDPVLERESPCPLWVNGYELTEVQINELKKIITSIVDFGSGYEGLIKSFEEDVDYNFCSFKEYGLLFLFHHACSRLHGKEFVARVIEVCHEVRQVRELMQLRDLQGRTPLHVTVAVGPVKARDDVLQNLMRCLRSQNSVWYLDVRDGRGWSPLHVAATQPYSDIFAELIGFADFDIGGARNFQDLEFKRGTDEMYCTTFHLAVLHNNPKFVEDLLWLYITRISIKGDFNEWSDPLKRQIYFDHGPTRFPDCWTVLSLSLLLGNVDLVELFLRRNCFLGTNLDYEGSEWMKIESDRFELDPIGLDWVMAAPIFLAAALVIQRFYVN